MDRFLSLKNSSSLSRRFTPWNAVICKQQNDVNIFQIFMQHTVSYVSLKVCRNGMNMYYISKKLTTDMGNLLYGWTFVVRKKFWQFPMQFTSCKKLFLLLLWIVLVSNNRLDRESIHLVVETSRLRPLIIGCDSIAKLKVVKFSVMCLKGIHENLCLWKFFLYGTTKLYSWKNRT